MSTKLFEAKGSLSKLKMTKYELPVQEIKTATELDLSGKGLNHLDAIVIAALIKVQIIAQNHLVAIITSTLPLQANRSLSKLNLANNQICGQNKWGNGTYDTAGLAALAKSIGNLKELNISSNVLKAEGAKILVPALEASGSLSELDLSGNKLRSEGLSVVSEALKSTSIRQLNIAENNLAYNQQGNTDMSGVIKFAEDIQDKGSLSKLDISGNRICGLNSIGNGTYDTSGLAALAKSIGNLKELNISNNFLQAEGAKILVPALKDAKGSLAAISLADSALKDEGAAHLLAAITR